MWLLFEIGCAECRSPHDETLVSVQPFETREEAEARATALWWDGPPGIERRLLWEPHPNGGVYSSHSQGESWIVSLAELRPGGTTE